MNVDIVSMPEQRVVAVTHVGPYDGISEAFERLGSIAGPAGLLQQSGAAMLALYQDDPKTKPAAELRSEAGLVVPDGLSVPDGLHEIRIPAGRYARTTHVGPYDKLGDAWASFMDWLPESGTRVGNGMAYELYRSMNSDKPDGQVTDLYMSVV